MTTFEAIMCLAATAAVIILAFGILVIIKKLNHIAVQHKSTLAHFDNVVSQFLTKHGWHPASELPPLDEDGNSQDLIVICGTMNFHCDLPRWSAVVGGVWGDKDVKWWCYPPKED